MATAVGRVGCTQPTETRAASDDGVMTTHPTACVLIVRKRAARKWRGHSVKRVGRGAFTRWAGGFFGFQRLRTLPLPNWRGPIGQNRREVGWAIWCRIGLASMALYQYQGFLLPKATIQADQQSLAGDPLVHAGRWRGFKSIAALRSEFDLLLPTSGSEASCWRGQNDTDITLESMADEIESVFVRIDLRSVEKGWISALLTVIDRYELVWVSWESGCVCRSASEIAGDLRKSSAARFVQNPKVFFS